MKKVVWSETSVKGREVFLWRVGGSANRHGAHAEHPHL
jgi:hypothetical protein